jgi:hypothetical protein
MSAEDQEPVWQVAVRNGCCVERPIFQMGPGHLVRVAATLAGETAVGSTARSLCAVRCESAQQDPTCTHVPKQSHPHLSLIMLQNQAVLTVSMTKHMQGRAAASKQLPSCPESGVYDDDGVQLCSVLCVVSQPHGASCMADVLLCLLCCCCCCCSHRGHRSQRAGSR